MSTFLRDLAIARFPKFGIVYRVGIESEPEINAKNQLRLTLGFYSESNPPKHLQSRPITLPLWKAGELLDLLEQGNQHWDDLPVVAVELMPRRPDDEYGELRLRLDLQPALDAFTGEPVRTSTEEHDPPLTEMHSTGPPKPAAEAGNVPSESKVGSERGQAGAGGEPASQQEPPAKQACGCPPPERICQETPRGIICLRCGGWV